MIDDPISSFDSNKLFSAYAYMKSQCDETKQLFVLTHNYHFFSLILGWFNKKYIKDSNGHKIPNFNIYRVENRFENDTRCALLNNGGESLKQATDYDYIFYTIYSYSLKDDKSLSKTRDVMSLGNLLNLF